MNMELKGTHPKFTEHAGPRLGQPRRARGSDSEEEDEGDGDGDDDADLGDERGEGEGGDSGLPDGQLDSEDEDLVHIAMSQIRKEFRAAQRQFGHNRREGPADDGEESGIEDDGLEYASLHWRRN